MVSVLVSRLTAQDLRLTQGPARIAPHEVHLSTTTPLRTLVPRLAAEFVVIVVGVLVALAVDGWTTSRSDAVLELEYLHRLLEDVEYDLFELEFVEVSAVESTKAATDLTSAARIRAMAPDLLTASALVAANQREPDLSRNTFRELLSSGRIDLLRSSDVRRALAAYDRLVNETSGVWSLMSTDLRRWIFSRVPTDVYRPFQEACESAGTATFNIQRVCSFGLDGWSAESLRADLMTAEVQEQLTFAAHRYRTAVEVVGHLRGGAEQLREVLEVELSGRQGGCRPARQLPEDHRPAGERRRDQGGC